MMFFIRWIHVLGMLPKTWYDALHCRKEEFPLRYAHLRTWCRKALQAFHIQLEVIEEAPLPKEEAIFFVSNHQGTADPLILVAAISTPFTFVSKVENKRIPILSSWSKTIELIYFDRKDTNSAVHMLRESARYLKRKQNLMIFPEGTRSKGREMLPFKGGAIKPAYLGKAWIVPVTQLHSYDFNASIRKKATIKVILGKPIAYEEYRHKDIEEFSKELQEILQHNLDSYK